MASFKTIVSFIMVAIAGIEAGVVPAFAPAVAPAPVAYANFAPYNIPPYASSVNVQTKSLAYPFAAPALATAPAFAPAVAAPVAPAFRYGGYPYTAGLIGSPYGYAAHALPVGRSVHAVAPAVAPAVSPAVAPVAYAGGVPAAPLGYSGLLPAPFA